MIGPRRDTGVIQFDSVFYEVTALLALAAVIGAVALLLKQPPLIAFIFVGILAGPTWLHLITAEDALDLLAEMGIALLLFIVGLRLDLHVIRTMGPVALLTGLGQVLFTSTVGFGLSLALGLSTVAALYVAVALTFSSTIIIVKLLSDKREIDALHGRIAIGFLIVQDIVVVLVMIGLSAFGASGNDHGIAVDGLLLLVKASAMLVAIAVMMRYVLPNAVERLARSQELLVLAAVAWALTLAAVGDALGFSKEVGAFLAGVSLASTPFRESISGRLTSLRDFLLLFFFLSLGASLDLSLVREQAWPALVLSLFVLIGNPILVMAIMGAMGYRKRTGFLAGLTVAQISEFSLILGALGVSLGHIGDETLGLITLVGLLTITLSTYLILYSHPLYDRISPILGVFERHDPYREHIGNEPDGQSWDCIVFGLGRYGGDIVRNLEARGLRVMGVDFDPDVVADWRQRGRHARYGDAEDPEFATSLPLQQARLIVSSVPQVATNLTLKQAVRNYGYEGAIALTAHTDTEARLLQEAQPTLILRPFRDAADQAGDLITEYLAATTR
jgi:Kef-type K+ transport system membrane component KefB